MTVSRNVMVWRPGGCCFWTGEARSSKDEGKSSSLVGVGERHDHVSYVESRVPAKNSEP